MNRRELLKDKKRIVVKIGSSSLTHEQTGRLNLIKIEKLVRELTNLRNEGREIVIVSSGAIAVGKEAAGLSERPKSISEKQACAAIGQGRLMMIYQKLFSEYNQLTGQILMTKNVILEPTSRENVHNTFLQLLDMGVIPIVNENDSISTYEMQFGDNDTLSAIVAHLVQADLLILLSDIDGLFSDDPNQNPDAEFIDLVEHLDEHFMRMAKNTSGSSVGTGGMSTKLLAAQIATDAGTDMLIANGKDFGIIHRIIEGEDVGTLFLANPQESYQLENYLEAGK